MLIVDNPKKSSHKNRGMYFEDILNKTNMFYLESEKAVIHKKPTPIKIIKTSGGQITNATFSKKSTTDYNGVYNAKYVDFEAKQTALDYLPISNLHPHQITHLKSITKSGGIGFFLIYFSTLERCFYINISNIDLKQSKITIEYLCKHGKEVLIDKYVRYLDVID